MCMAGVMPAGWRLEGVVAGDGGGAWLEGGWLEGGGGWRGGVWRVWVAGRRGWLEGVAVEGWVVAGKLAGRWLGAGGRRGGGGWLDLVAWRGGGEWGAGPGCLGVLGGEGVEVVAGRRVAGRGGGEVGLGPQYRTGPCSAVLNRTVPKASPNPKP